MLLCRVSYRIFELGRKQDGSRMIVVCESVCDCLLGRSRGMPPPPPRKILNLDPLRSKSGTNFPNNILMTHTYVQ